MISFKNFRSEINESKFEPHMMYDPKTGKGYKANTMDDHLRMKKLGYTHDKISEAAKVVAKIWYGPNNKTKSKSFPDEGKALAWVKKMQDIEDVSDYSLQSLPRFPAGFLD